jgi:hypothetical protein
MEMSKEYNLSGDRILWSQITRSKFHEFNFFDYPLLCQYSEKNIFGTKLIIERFGLLSSISISKTNKATGVIADTYINL